MKSRLAAISLGCKQPKTHPRVGTKKPVRSSDVNSLTRAGTKTRAGQYLSSRTVPGVWTCGPHRCHSEPRPAVVIAFYLAKGSLTALTFNPRPSTDGAQELAAGTIKGEVYIWSSLATKAPQIIPGRWRSKVRARSGLPFFSIRTFLFIKLPHVFVQLLHSSKSVGSLQCAGIGPTRGTLHRRY
jgi:hypothetical protein